MWSCGSRSCGGLVLPAIMEPGRRIDQALWVVMEVYVNRVSTRAVDDLVAALGIESEDPHVVSEQPLPWCAGREPVRPREVEHRPPMGGSYGQTTAYVGRP